MPTNFHKNVLLCGVLALAPALARGMPGGAGSPGAAAGGTVSAEAKADAPRIQLSVPLFSEAFADAPVAQVGGEAISLREVGDALAMTHSTKGGAAKKQDLQPLLDRLIEGRLLVLEARAIGLDDLAEVKNALAYYRRTTTREILKKRAVAKVKPDPAAVEALYRPAVREWKVRSVLFAQEADAAAFAAGAKDAASFGAAAASVVAAGKATGNEEPQFIGRNKGLPQVIAAIEKMKVGQVSAPVKVSRGHAVVLLEDTRDPEVPEARAEVERMVMAPKLQETLRDYFRALTKKHATVDRKLLAALDYEAKKPGFDRLAKDKRVIARIRGEAPITVADLTAEIRTQIFHGIERAKEKKVNRKKEPTFESLLFRRLLDKEAKVQGVADEPEFRRNAAEYERSVLFTAFVERVIVPDVKVGDEDARAYFDAHQSDFSYPDFYRLETVAFERGRDAQAACEKLKAGTDIKWLRANAEGQLDREERSLQVDGNLVTTESMPEELTSILSGARAGDCRIYAKSDGECYAVLVVEKVAARVQPFDEAKPAVSEKVFQEKVARSVAEWAKKLREAHEVNVFVTGIGG